MRTMVTLKDGNEVLEAFANITLHSISTMPDDGIVGILAQYDLVRMAHDDSYKPQQSQIDYLHKRGLAGTDGSMHYDIKSFVRCAFSIGEDGMSIVHSSPFKTS